MKQSLDFKVKKEKTDFGYVFHYTCREGRFALYYYDDDLSRIFLSNVDIWEQYQGKGLGNELLKFALDECNKFKQKFGFKEVLLWCNKNSFVHKWYKKLGFNDLTRYEENPNYIWMCKTI